MAGEVCDKTVLGIRVCFPMVCDGAGERMDLCV